MFLSFRKFCINHYIPLSGSAAILSVNITAPAISDSAPVSLGARSPSFGAGLCVAASSAGVATSIRAPIILAH